MHGSREGGRGHADGRGRVSHVGVQIGIQEEERCCAEQQCSGLEARGGREPDKEGGAGHPDKGNCRVLDLRSGEVVRIWKWSVLYG